MEAYHVSLPRQNGEQPERQCLFLGPAWFIACGLGAILGGFFMRGNPFSWALVMLGGGVGLVGATWLYRNVMKARRHSGVLSAANGVAGGGNVSAGLGLGVLGLPLTAAVRFPPDESSSAVGPLVVSPEMVQGAEYVAPVYVVLLEKAQTPLEQCAAHTSPSPVGPDGTAGTATGAAPATDSTTAATATRHHSAIGRPGPPQSEGHSSCKCTCSAATGYRCNGNCSRCGGNCCCAVQREVWREEVEFFADAVALGVQLAAPARARPTDLRSAGGGLQDGDMGACARVGHAEAAAEVAEAAAEVAEAEAALLQQGVTASAAAASRPGESRQGSLKTQEREEEQQVGEVPPAGAGGFVVVLQPKPQLLGFSMRVVKELPWPPPLQPRFQQRLPQAPRAPRYTSAAAMAAAAAAAAAAAQAAWQQQQQQHQRQSAVVMNGTGAGLPLALPPWHQHHGSAWSPQDQVVGAELSLLPDDQGTRHQAWGTSWPFPPPPPTPPPPLVTPPWSPPQPSAGPPPLQREEPCRMQPQSSPPLAPGVQSNPAPEASAP